MTETLDHATFVEMAVTLWAIWFARQRLIHDSDHQSPLSTYMFVRDFLSDLAQTPPPTSDQRKKPTVVVPCVLPLVGLAKLNADAATAKNDEGGALAVVCHNDSGMFLGASALTLAGSYSSATLEAIAVCEALALAQDLNLTHICVATDCLEVVNNLTQTYNGVYGAITREIKETARLFTLALFRH
jgi:hypothetical protein